MIACSRPVRHRRQVPEWHKAFLAMLPAIVAYARSAFRHSHDREELIQEAVANSCVAFARLAELGKLDLAYPTVLARYAVAQIADGRRVGSRLNIKDVSSPYAQKMKGFRLARLDHRSHDEECWSEVLVEDKHAGPAETASARLDFSDWLHTLGPRNRKLAMFLAAGNRTLEAAEKFGVCEARVSQLRKELKRAWLKFQGEESEAAAAVA